MTNEMIPAFALAAYVRNEMILRDDELQDEDVGNNFLVEDWRKWYEQALKFAKHFESAYPDPKMRVHKILPYPASMI